MHFFLKIGILASLSKLINHFSLLESQLCSTPFECEKSALEAVCSRRKSKVRSEEVEANNK